MMDAYRSLKDFYSTKTTIDGTDLFLTGLFEGESPEVFLGAHDTHINGVSKGNLECLFYTENQVELKRLALDSHFENPKMAKLESTLLKQFEPDGKSRGIIFSKTRKSTHCLKDWVLQNSALQTAGIKADILTGAGNGITYMTQV